MAIAHGKKACVSSRNNILWEETRMNERDKRDFNAGLAEEVDAWLRGDTSRRSFLTKLMLTGGAAMLPGLGWTAAGSKAWADTVDLSKLDLADPSTPLGKAQAAAMK